MTNTIPQVTLTPVEEQTPFIQPVLHEEEQHATASISTHSSAATQITLKNGDAFLIADDRGNFAMSRQEMGLFSHGTRFLRTCNLSLEGHPLMVLSHHIANLGDCCQIDLTNHPFTAHTQIAQGEIHIARQIALQPDRLSQTLTITSFHTVPVPLTLSLHLGSDFCDLFEVRGTQRAQRGTLHPPHIQDNTLVLGYRGLDQIERETRCTFTPSPDQSQGNQVSWQLHLLRGEPIEIHIDVKLSALPDEQLLLEAASHTWDNLPQPILHTDDVLLNRLLTRSMHDLMMLSTQTPYGHYPYAGVPWFSCPFGRDGLITCLEFLPWFPSVARGTLAFLAAHQGTKVEPFTDEQPGKILHEMRKGEMANCREIPYIPYYGSIDVTPLFLIVLEGYIRWTDDIAFLEHLWPHAEAAARWLTDYGDRDGDSFIEYHKDSSKGLDNQGWKDAWDAISHRDGRIAASPIALCEVQGYAFAAYRAVSYLAQRLGRIRDSLYWEQRAREIQQNFLQHFWWEQEQVFYLALDKDKQPCEVVSSNTGQCLWTGIVPQEQAHKIINRLMEEDMYSGWGIRTLSTQAARYNPMSYHNGSVWPHDTAILGAGFAQYGGKDETSLLLRSMLEASLYYEGARLPELFCGFTQRPGYGPTRYPVACSPQAWAAGAPFLLVNALLGLQADADQQRLILHQPALPDWLHTLEIDQLYVGQQRIHLKFERSGQQTQVLIGEHNQIAIQII